MGLFNKILGSKVKEEKETNVNWIPLNSLEQIKTIKELSKSETIFVFKHSTRCGISSMVIKRFENLFDSSMNNIKVYYLDLLNFRAISDEVGYSFQAQHQSPQLLIIRNEVAVLNVSHYDITTVNIQKYL
ncbi:bacillithiol system redox-active protein YtxJ [Flavobacteriaceae bacterium]|nr:bacillithiol system redox-active protein YtxJ [Flavobacteriaceae bacterium]MDB9893466.1 bacillithiol system redox-active protein YtxJ [Flavobacteriaceae bacterium]MDB9928160.1 bacillithiol system redox-active protein YtxJ [Flavobacteriaceae bacterium]MDC1342459.1 bacillithiol system redox-active protein YtxJ [Flavobacteriaceae bacterium]